VRETSLPNMVNERDRNTDRLYQFIHAYVHEHGYAPTTREMAGGCFIALSSIPRYLDRLEMQGRISREIGKARSIVLLEGKN
jgi:SOS-response transcriptional repressor LexA